MRRARLKSGCPSGGVRVRVPPPAPPVPRTPGRCRRPARLGRPWRARRTRLPMPSSSGIRRSTAWRSPSSTRQSRSRSIPDDVAERLRFPERSTIVSIPVRMDNGRRVVFPGYRVQHSSITGPTKGGIRYDPGSDARRVRGARDVDDVEVLAPAPSVRRREGWCSLRPASPVARRARAADAPLHLGAPADHRPEGGHPCAGHGHERADDGMDDGHVLDAAAATRCRRSSPGSRSRSAAPCSARRRPAPGS